MSESTALQAWRRRARGGGERRSRPSTKAVFGATAATVLACALLGGRVLNGEGTPAQPATALQSAGPHPPPCPVVATGLQADVNGDGCDEAVSFADGVLTAGAVRMRVGVPGDDVALGRWSCGPVTLALLRPATGELFRFDGWASAGHSVPATVIGRVEGAVGVHASAREGGRCDDLVVTRTSGPPVLLPERPVAG
jgi:hypothetical protein